jgi:cytochrome P450
MIFYEVLRLYPPAIEITRYTYKELEIGGIKYPAGVLIGLPVLLIHQDPELWGKDALEFKPERFVEGIGKATNNKVCFLPFSWGPRICIGQNYALLEAKMCLSRILQKFEFHLSPTYVHAPLNILTLQPQHGVQIRISKI